MKACVARRNTHLYVCHRDRIKAMEAEMIEEAAAKQRDAGTSGRGGDYEDEGRGVRHNGGSDRSRDDGRRCVFVGV